MKITVSKTGAFQIVFKIGDIKKILKKNEMVFADMTGSISLGERKKDIKKVRSRGTFRFYKTGRAVTVDFIYAKLLEEFKGKGQSYEKGSVLFFNKRDSALNIDFNTLFNFRLKDSIYNFYYEKTKNDPRNRNWQKEMSDMRKKLLKSKR